MKTHTLKVALTATLTLVPVFSPVFAGGRGGGGFHGGGGGGFRGGGFAGGGFAGGGAHFSAPHYNAPSAGFSHVTAPRYGSNNAFNANVHSPSFTAPRSVNNFSPNRANYGNIGNRTVNNANINRNVNNVNRTNVGNIGNRTNIGNVGSNNRVNVGGNNRIGNTSIGNRTVVNNNFTNVNRGVTNVNRGFTNVNRGFANNVPGNFSHLNGGLGWTGRNGYYGYHSGWSHGFWNYGYPRGFYGGYGYGGWGWGGGLGGFGWGYGAGLTTGLLAFGLGSGLYNWGYGSYYNPYYYAQPSTIVVNQPVVVGQPPIYNYGQPIDTTAPPPEESVASAATSIFDEARAAFMAGDYPTALQKTDMSLVKMPNDPTIHEFRALVFFAMKQYDQSATALFPVLASGPGWDWTTMVSLYPSVDVYTAQLLALQHDSAARPDSAQDHFVLAYHYLTQGYPKNAEYELKQVVALQPKDQLSIRLLEQLKQVETAPPGGGGPAGGGPGGGGPAGGAPPAGLGGAPPVDGGPPPSADTATPPPSTVALSGIVGDWKASPNPDTAIALSIKDDSTFVWKVDMKGTPKTLSGTLTLGNDVLTLVPTTGDPLAGRVALKSPTSMSFKAVGGPPNDPGLSFGR